MNKGWKDRIGRGAAQTWYVRSLLLGLKALDKASGITPCHLNDSSHASYPTSRYSLWHYDTFTSTVHEYLYVLKLHVFEPIVLAIGRPETKKVKKNPDLHGRI